MVPMLTKKVTSRSPDRGLKKFLALWPACFSGLSHVWNIVHYFIASSILVLVLLSNLLWGIADVNAAIPVSWTVDKPLAEVLPNEDLVTLSFKVETPPGKPGVTGAVPVRIKLIAPQTHPLVTTDFPHVENSVLLDFIAYAREGAFTLKQVFPIRGDYRLWVAPVEPPAGRDSAPSLSGDTDRLAEKKELSPESSPSPEIVLQVYVP
jgi:hypothetical protein